MQELPVKDLWVTELCVKELYVKELCINKELGVRVLPGKDVEKLNVKAGCVRVLHEEELRVKDLYVTRALRIKDMELGDGQKPVLDCFGTMSNVAGKTAQTLMETDGLQQVPRRCKRLLLRTSRQNNRLRRDDSNVQDEVP